MLTKYFTSDEYHTSKSTRRALLDKAALNTRFYFVSKYVSIVLKTRRQALRGMYDTEAWAVSSFDIFKLIESCGGKFHITGLDNIRRCPEPVVFVSNHMSTLETMILPCIIAPERKVTFVVKDSLVTNPFFGAVMRSRISDSTRKGEFERRLVGCLGQGTGIVVERDIHRNISAEHEDGRVCSVEIQFTWSETRRTCKSSGYPDCIEDRLLGNRKTCQGLRSNQQRQANSHSVWRASVNFRDGKKGKCPGGRFHHFPFERVEWKSSITANLGGSFTRFALPTLTEF